MDSIFAFLESNVVRYTIGDIIPTRVGSRHPLSAPFDLYQAKDGFVVIAIANDSFFVRLCKLMEQPELIKDERFITDPQRSDYDKELKEIIEKWLSKYTVAEGVDILTQHSIPSSPVLSIDQVCQDINIQHRDMLVDVQHPQAGNVKVTGNPVKLSRTPPLINKPSPLLGQHNKEILIDLLGYADSEIAGLKKKKVF